MKEIQIYGVTIQYNKDNVRIVDSYKVKEKDMRSILCMFLYEVGTIYERPIYSWIKEWKAHNRLYKLGLFRNHTRDCDLEENEKWYRLLAYQILGI